MKKLLLFLVAGLTFSCTARAETSIWMIRSGSATAYLGGTFHLLRASDFPLPDEFEFAYSAAQTVVLETDIDRLNSPEVQQRLLARGVYPPGRGIDQVLSPATFRLLSDYCHDNGLPLEFLGRFKPSLLYLTLLAFELQNAGIDQKGVDAYFYGRAPADGKKTAALESVEQQVDYLLALGEGDEDRFIRQVLGELAATRVSFEAMLAAWRSGDEAAMERLLVAGTKAEYPDIYQRLFLERNAAWLPRLESLASSPETELVLVGAAHLVGEDGLVAQLRRRGFSVEKLHLAPAAGNSPAGAPADHPAEKVERTAPCTN